MYNIENNMPKFVQKAVHVKRATIKPNEPPSSVWQKVTWALGSTRKVQFIEAGHKDQTQKTFESLAVKIQKQQLSLKSIQATLQQHSFLLSQLAEKLDIHLPTVGQPGPSAGPAFHSDIVSINPPSDSLAVYDGPPSGSNVMDRRRQRSVRVPATRTERPRSTII